MHLKVFNNNKQFYINLLINDCGACVVFGSFLFALLQIYK